MNGREASGVIRALSVLVENLNSVPRTLMRTHNCVYLTPDLGLYILSPWTLYMEETLIYIELK